MNEEKETLLEFPCQFPVKAMGVNKDEFVAHVLNLLAPHCPTLDESHIKTRPSSSGKYVSVTITVTATSQLHLDAIYYSLTDSERVLMAL